MSSEPNRPSALSYIIGNTVVLVVGFLAAYMALVLGHAASADILDPRTVDFLQYFSVGRVVLDGHAADMYRWAPMLHVEQRIAFPYTVPVHTVQPSLIYPPFTALVFAPLAVLPYDAARLVWFILSAAGLASALYLLSRIAGLSSRGDLILRASTLLSLPLLQAVREGQVTIFLLLALVGAYVFAVKGNVGAAGICLAAFTVKPQYAIPIILVLAVRRHYALLLSFFAWVLLFLAVPTAIFGLDTLSGYFRTIAGLQHGGPMFNSASESIYGLAQEVLPGRAGVLAWGIASLAVIVFLAWYARRAPSISVPFALSTIAALLISPHLLLHELLLLLLPAAVAVREARRRGRKVGWPLAAAYVAILAAVPLSLFIPLRITTFAILGLGVLLVYVSRPVTAGERAVAAGHAPGLVPAVAGSGSQAKDGAQLPELGGAEEVGGG